MIRPENTVADVIVIGGGPGGYVAAIRAAQLGGKVVLVEKDELGGVCLNRGCIPTKAMLSSADVYDTIARRSAEFGVRTGQIALDFEQVVERRQRIVKQLASGVSSLVKKNGIQVIKGTARLLSRDTVEITLADGHKESVIGRNIILATGSEPITLSVPGLEGENIWDSDAALRADSIPASVLIIGGGYIGVEWGYMFCKFGSKVTIVEAMPEILPQTDSEVAGELRKILENDGVKILRESKVIRVEHRQNAESVFVMTGGSEQEIRAEKVLVSVGRKPVSANLGLEELGVSTDGGRILVDDHMQTNVPGIYAVGDVVGGMLLAHKASKEGKIAAENCMGQHSKMSYHRVPGAIYTTPEIAVVGISEDAAKMQGLDYQVGRFHFRANGKALAIGETKGFVKILVDKKYGEILGCHMIGPHVTDLIHEVVVGMEAEATIETICHAIHAHPTLSEAVHEAALDAIGEALHKG